MRILEPEDGGVESQRVITSKYLSTKLESSNKQKHKNINLVSSWQADKINIQ
jgi:hypothetical protein